jgi:FkbM family methyltransferase
MMVSASPGARHLLVEPVAELARQLEVQFPTCEVLNGAFDSEAGDAEFTVVVERPTRSGFTPQRVPAGAHTEVRRVHKWKLDDVVRRRVQLVKVDVEGSELEVLRGAERTLRDVRPVVVFEHEQAPGPHNVTGTLYSYLTGLGYRVFDIDGRGPFDSSSFAESAASGQIWNYVAVPSTASR